MNIKYLIVVSIFCLQYQISQCKYITLNYISTEHPVIQWFDTKVFQNFTMNSKRLNRQDPRHYVELYVHTLFIVNHSVMLDFYFHQFLKNRYKPSFVEMHLKFCDMIDSDWMFGQPILIALKGQKCPFPSGVYDMINMTIPYVPKGFPFNKGRIYCNVSKIEGDVKIIVALGWIDMEIKTGKINKN